VRQRFGSMVAILLNSCLATLGLLTGGCGGPSAASCRAEREMAAYFDSLRHLYVDTHPELTEEQRRTALEEGFCVGMSMGDVEAIWGRPTIMSLVTSADSIERMPDGRTHVVYGPTHEWGYHLRGKKKGQEVRLYIRFADRKVVSWERTGPGEGREHAGQKANARSEQ
jgi:hypothetical protein